MDEARLNLAVKLLQGASLVEADGELGPWTMEAFCEALRKASDGDSRVVILDLTRVESMDVGALRVLRDACVALGEDRKLCTVARGKPRRMLEMTRFDEMLDVYAQLQDALDAAGKAASAA
jgi:anti-anti-sigma factor